MFVLPSGLEFLGIKTLNIFICSFLNNENHIYFLLSLSHIVTLSNKALFLYELHGLPKKKKRISHFINYQEKSLLILVTLKFRLAIVQKDRPYEITLSSIFKPETAHKQTDSTVIQLQWSVVIRAVLYFSNNRPCQDTFFAVTNL